MTGKICCFAGHSEVYDTKAVSAILKDKIEYLNLNENVKEFWAGNYGQFDMLAAKCVRELKNKYKDIELILVIPYITKEINEYKEQYYAEYDEIIMADIPLSTPNRLKILKCNEYMVRESEYMICYVKYSWGGAAKTLNYAKKMKLNIININDVIKSK